MGVNTIFLYILILRLEMCRVWASVAKMNEFCIGSSWSNNVNFKGDFENHEKVTKYIRNDILTLQR